MKHKLLISILVLAMMWQNAPLDLDRERAKVGTIPTGVGIRSPLSPGQNLRPVALAEKGIPTPDETGIEAVFYDIGNVILTSDYRLVAEGLAPYCSISRTKQQKQELIADYLNSKKVREPYETGRQTTSLYYRKMRRNLKVSADISNEQLGEILCSGLGKPREEMVRFMRRLKAAGYRLYLVSETTPLHRKYLMRKYPELFDTANPGCLIEQNGFVTSYEVGAMKDSPRIFRKALSKAGLRQRPQCALFIDDVKVNTEMAAGVGIINTIHAPIGIDITSAIEDFLNAKIKPSISALLEQKSELVRGLSITRASKVLGVSRTGLGKYLRDHTEAIAKYGIEPGRLPYRRVGIKAELEHHRDEIKGKSIRQASIIIDCSEAGLSEFLIRHPEAISVFELNPQDAPTPSIRASLRAHKEEIRGKTIYQVVGITGVSHSGLYDYFIRHPNEIIRYEIINGEKSEETSVRAVMEAI